jgi:hypothetical protein
MHRDIGAVIEGAEQEPRAEGVVDDERQPMRLGDPRHRLEVDHVDVGVADGLDEDQLRLRRDRRAWW